MKGLVFGVGVCFGRKLLIYVLDLVVIVVSLSVVLRFVGSRLSWLVRRYVVMYSMVVIGMVRRLNLSSCFVLFVVLCMLVMMCRVMVLLL